MSDRLFVAVGILSASSLAGLGLILWGLILGWWSM